MKPWSEITSRAAGLSFCLWMLAMAGCVDPPSPHTGIRTYGASVPTRPVSQHRPAVPSAKAIPPSQGASFVPAPATKSVLADGGGGKGDLDDVISRIRERKAGEARAEEKRRREARDNWLEAHDKDFALVVSRLKSMRIFAATTQDASLKDRVRRAIAQTEADIDKLRSRLGDGDPVGFGDASAIRSALESRHESLAVSSEEYRKIVGE